jgi:hypothetical protein
MLSSELGPYHYMSLVIELYMVNFLLDIMVSFDTGVIVPVVVVERGISTILATVG